jgi:hypothetical protein
MMLEDIDPNIRRVVAAKQRELEANFLRVRLKRCEKGIVNPVGWEMMWRDFIRKSVARAVADYLATNKPGSRTRSERPTAPLNSAPATQVALPSTAAVECYKRF